MAYVRRRGKQLAIVHGQRDSETKKVDQRILFTIYSKPEALEVLGRGERSGKHRFRTLLDAQNPGIRFRWERMYEAI